MWMHFLCNEDGAITVDWVVICAAVVMFAVFATYLVGSSVVTSVDATTASMDTPTFGQ